MFQGHPSGASRVAAVAAIAILSLARLTAAQAQTTEATETPNGHIDFAVANLPPATVEIDLSQEIFSDLFGLGDAAVAGIVESLAESNAKHASEATELVAEKLAAGRQILNLAKEVVREVHVRVYEQFPEEVGSVAELAARFDEQLANGKWDNVVKVRDGKDSVHASFLRVEGSILGVFAVVADGKDVVVANLVCDVSPENVRQLTAAATKIGLENGLREKIEHELRTLR